MLDWKDRLEELSVKCSTLVRYGAGALGLGADTGVDTCRFCRLEELSVSCSTRRREEEMMGVVGDGAGTGVDNGVESCGFCRPEELSVN